jgi:hypothetical protein
MSQPRFAWTKPHAPPWTSSGRPLTGTALAHGLPSRRLGGEDFFQPSGSADMSGTQTSPTANVVAMGLLLGEPAGTRTQDTRIKSPVLYRLSYGLI